MLLQLTVFLLLAVGYAQKTTTVPISPSAEDVSCTLEDGSIGECVPYLFCKNQKQGNVTSIYGCQKSFDTCCSVEKRFNVNNVTTTPNTPTTVTTVTTTVSTGEDKIEYCTTENGLKGECVRYYLCFGNKTVNEGGLDIIDIRATDDDQCSSYLDSCCSYENQLSTTPEPKKSERQGCGWRNPDGVGFIITGGNSGETNFAEFPWVVAILSIKPKDDTMKVYRCGGSLIHPSVVLTGAHCVASHAGNLIIRAGEWDTQTFKELYPYQQRRVVSMDLHKDFHKGTLYFDYAVLFLESPVDLVPNVGLACLPPPMEITAPDTRCFITGWGKNKFGKEGVYQVILKKIEVPVVERNTCQSALRKTRLGRPFKLHSSFMCAGGEKDKDACKGDGGSPLSCPIANQKDRYVQSGMVAWGIGCGEEGVPGVYVDIAYMRTWIDEKVIAKGYDPKTYTI